MRRRSAALLTLLAALGLALGCASKLDRVKTKKRPTGAGLEESLNLDDVVFRAFDDGREVRLGQEMRARGLDHALLVFGSRGCHICNKKARELQDSVIGQHPLFLQGGGFDVIGVNTDPDRPERLRGYLAAFPFIQWSDPGGSSLLKFLPMGRDLGVPLTVLVREGGIVWRILADEPASVPEIMARVEASLRGESPGPLPGGDGGDGGGDGNGGDDGGGDGGDGGDGGEDPDPTPSARARRLADVLPGRLEHATGVRCDGGQGTVAALAGAVDLTFVHVTRGVCDDACRAATEHAQAQCARGLPGGGTCAVVRLSEARPAACDPARDLVGGGAFFDVFATHFNAAYTPVLDEESGALLMPPVEGPLFLAFEADGRLALAHEGALTPRVVDEKLAAVRGGRGVLGPDFPLYRKDRGVVGFAAVRRQARYTVLNVFAAYPVMCGGCMLEQKRWSEPGGLVDFCAARPADCQVLAVEGNPPDWEETLARYYDRVLHGDAAAGYAGFGPLGIRLPLYLDARPPYDDEGAEDFRRLRYYLEALKPEWYGAYGTLVYDADGKVVATFVAPDPGDLGHDEVKAYLEKALAAP